MRHAFRHLGLSPTADQRAIKRAYAARLKQTRPEDDPAGFQVLQQCYEEALEWARAEARRLESVAASGPEAHPGRYEASPPEDFDDAEEVPPLVRRSPEAQPAVLIDGPDRAADPAPRVVIRDQPAPAWTLPVWTVSQDAADPAPRPAPQIVGDVPPAPVPPARVIADDPPPALSQRPPLRLIDGAEAPPPATPAFAPEAGPRPLSGARQRPPLQAPPDPGALADAVLARAFQGGLSDWLDAHPQLLDLGLRDRLGGMVAARMDRLADLPGPQEMAALAEFFGWEPLSSPPLVRQVLARAAVQTQLVEDAAIQYAYQEEQRHQRDQARLLLQPFEARKHYRYALFPSHVSQLLARLSRLDVDSERQLGRILDPRTLAFWARLGAPGMNGTRAWLMLLRAMALAVPPALVGLLRGAGAAVPLLWLGFTVSFLTLQWLFVGGRWLRQRTLRQVHYWRSPRADALLAIAAAAVLGLGLLWPDGTVNTLARFGGWFFVVLGLGPRRALPLVIAGLIWLFVFPVAWSAQTPLLAPYATLFTALVLDRVIAKVGVLSIGAIHQSNALACWNLLPPLLLAIAKNWL